MAKNGNENAASKWARESNERRAALVAEILEAGIPRLTRERVEAINNLGDLVALRDAVRVVEPVLAVPPATRPGVEAFAALLEQAGVKVEAVYEAPHNFDWLAIIGSDGCYYQLGYNGVSKFKSEQAMLDGCGPIAVLHWCEA